MPHLSSTRSVLAATLLLSATLPALAAPPPAGSASRGSAAQRLGAPPHADVKPFESAKLSLSQAIADARKEMRGKTLDARFEVWRAKPAYLIRTYSASQVWQSRINADTGGPMGEPKSVSARALGASLHRNLTALNSAQTTLEQAISKAEQQRGGKAIMASVKSARSGTADYAVDLVKNGRLHTAMVDAASGKMR